MSKVSSLNEIPAGQKYVLVIYGEEYAQTGHPLGFPLQLPAPCLTVVPTAKETAKHTGIPEVFVCAAPTPGLNPTFRGMGTLLFPSCPITAM